jgi:predicted nucleic acid-binding protein
MALTGPLAGARTIALDAAVFIYLIEKHPTFFAPVEPIFAELDAGTVRGVTSVITLLEVLVKPLETGATALADEFRAAVAASTTLRVLDVDRPLAERAAAIRATYRCRTPDAIQLATAQLGGADVFVTNDDKLRRFADVPVVTVTMLATP